jgi:hypothetical protein
MLVTGFTAKEFVAGFDACKLATEEERCVRYRRGPNHHSVTAASVFIRFLQHQGELPLPVAPPSASDLWPMLGEFRSWMRKHRGLTETTLDVYQGILVGLPDALGDDGELVPTTNAEHSRSRQGSEGTMSSALEGNCRRPPCLAGGSRGGSCARVIREC